MIDNANKNSSKNGRQTTSPIKDTDDIRLIYKRLFKWQRHREAELVVIGCNVGLRISDLLRIRFGDIDRQVKDGVTVGYVGLTEKKTKKFRLVTFNPTALAAVDRLHERNPDHVYLFQATGNRIGNRIQPVGASWVSKCLKDVQQALELDYNLNTHSLRKTFGFHAYNNGADINVLQRLFNHSSVQETFIYIGITEERVRDVYLNYQVDVSV